MFVCTLKYGRNVPLIIISKSLRINNYFQCNFTFFLTVLHLNITEISLVIIYDILKLIK